MTFAFCEDKAAWDKFVENSPQGHVFCYSTFLDALPDTYRLATVIENGDIVMGAIVLVRGETILKAPYPLTIYQGLLCGGEVEAMAHYKRPQLLLERITFLMTELDKIQAGMSFCVSPYLVDLRAFQWFHYHEAHLSRPAIDLRYTGVINFSTVTTFDIYLSGIRNDRRRDYERARAKGFQVKPSNDIDLLNSLHAMTFERQGILRDEFEERILRGVCKAALENGFGELLVCEDDRKQPASASLFLYDKRYGYYYIGANDPTYRKTGAGTLLVIENIRRCYEKGLAGVDVVGVNSPKRGDFKTSLNAQAVPYYVIDYGSTQNCDEAVEAVTASS